MSIPKLLDEQLAFYTIDRNRSIFEAIKDGNLDEVRIARITQEQGDDIAYHGTPLYEKITHLVDIESGESFEHYMSNYKQTVSFIPMSDFEARISLEKSYVNKSIQYHEDQITRCEKQIENLMNAKGKLNKIIAHYFDQEEAEVTKGIADTNVEAQKM